MKPQFYFLSAAILQILAIIGSTLHDTWLATLPEAIYQILSYSISLTYLATLAFLAWIVYKTDKTARIIIAVILMILFSLISRLYFILFAFLDIEHSYQNSLMISIPSFLLSIYFIGQLFSAKNPYYASHFKLIAWGFIAQFILSITIPYLLDISGLYSKSWATNLFGLAPIIPIIALMIKSIKQEPIFIPTPFLVLPENAEIILDTNLN